MHDNPALSEAVEQHDEVVPLFVFDEALLRSHGTPRRHAFLASALNDLRNSLRHRGGDLVVRRGDPVAETMLLAREHAAGAVYLTFDASAYAQRRQQRLARERIDLRLRHGVAVVEPGGVVPEGRDHYRVFTPYWRRWRAEPVRTVLDPPRRIELPGGIVSGELVSAQPGGESEGRRRLAHWLREGLGGYARLRDRPAEAATSRLSPYLHFGCLSATELASRASGAEEFLRQLCWRDFFLQLLAANPQLEREDLHPRGEAWHDDPEAFERWRAGDTGVPIVDAAMRQLNTEGWLSNRARLIVAAYLTKTLGLDWRAGAAVFSNELLDADVASNTGNWQWVAGTGVDTRPRGFSAARQAKRFDPDGAYVRRYGTE